MLAEEVEEVITVPPDGIDVSGACVPDDRFGEAVAALVECRPGSISAETDLLSYVRSHLAGYKSPKHLIAADSIGQAPNGKVNHTALRRVAQEWAPLR